MLLLDTGYISFEDYDDIQKHCNEIIRFLSNVKTTKKTLVETPFKFPLSHFHYTL